MNEIYKNSNAKTEDRVEDLLSRMTLEEKAAQMIQVAYIEVSKEDAVMWAKRGTGSFLHVLGDNAIELQKHAMSARLGIPLLFGIDAIHGHGLYHGAAIFPSQLAAACSWNRDLVQQMGRITAKEVAADGLHWTFSPVLCLGRDTRWGRIDETFGEDPYLAGELGAAIIKGYQGDDLAADDSILACAKHFIGYGEATGGRDSYDTEITFRKLKEVFLPPFKKAIEAGCATVMTAYGSIDGTPFTASEKALKTILKDEIGFDGFVVTDWDNVTNLITRQFVASNYFDAVKLAVNAGNDMMMNTPKSYEQIIKLVQDGLLDTNLIDDSVRRILKIKFLAGLFDKAGKLKLNHSVIGCKDHLDENYRAAKECVVLLENRNNTLPFSHNIKNVAVIGPNADDLLAQYGDWTYFTHPSPKKDIEPAKPFFTVLGGMKETAAQLGVNIVYHKGCHIENVNDEDIAGAVKLAQQTDAIVLVLGDIHGQFGEWSDRADLSLFGSQQKLFDSLRSLDKPLVTVLVASKPLCIPEIAQKTDALLTNFNGGQYGGLAIAEAIFGKINPCGKLPITFPRHSGQMPLYYNYLPGWHGDRNGSIYGGPLYEFGYGLSYTNFSYSEFKVSGLEAEGKEKRAGKETQFITDTDACFNASVKVKNTGNRAGVEIVQIYFNDNVSTVLTPVKQLIAFERVELGTGEEKTISFTLKKMDFSLVLPDEKRVVEKGSFTLMAGGDSRDKSLLKIPIEIF